MLYVWQCFIILLYVHLLLLLTTLCALLGWLTALLVCIIFLSKITRVTTPLFYPYPQIAMPLSMYIHFYYLNDIIKTLLHILGRISVTSSELCCSKSCKCVARQIIYVSYRNKMLQYMLIVFLYVYSKAIKDNKVISSQISSQPISLPPDGYVTLTFKVENVWTNWILIPMAGNFLGIIVILRYYCDFPTF